MPRGWIFDPSQNFIWPLPGLNHILPASAGTKPTGSEPTTTRPKLPAESILTSVEPPDALTWNKSDVEPPSCLIVTFERFVICWPPTSHADVRVVEPSRFK